MAGILRYKQCQTHFAIQSLVNFKTRTTLNLIFFLLQQDYALYAISYLWSGSARDWNFIEVKNYSAAIEFFEKMFPGFYQSVGVNDFSCPDYHLHKTIVIEPDLIEEETGLKVHRYQQKEGEFVITYPYGLNGGCNLGANIQETVNFGSPKWVKLNKRRHPTNRCTCILDDNEQFLIDWHDIPNQLQSVWAGQWAVAELS